MIPPRTAKSPGSVTVGACEKPIRTRKALSASTSSRWSTRAVKLASRRTSRAGTRWVAALSVVSRMIRLVGRPWASAASVAIRVADTSALGDTRS